MAELNEAWRILRDPRRRADYDVAVGIAPHPGSPAATGAPGGASPTARPATWTPTRPGERPPTVVATEPVGCGTGVWVGAALLVVVLLVGALGAYVATVPDDDPGQPPPSPVAEQWAVGSCVLVTPSASGPVAIGAGCGGPTSGRIDAVVPYPSPCPAGTREVALVAERTTLCLVAP